MEYYSDEYETYKLAKKLAGYWPSERKDRVNAKVKKLALSYLPYNISGVLLITTTTA